MILEKIQEEVKSWKEKGYKNIKPQTENILNYLKEVSFLHDPQLEAFETYVYLKEVKNNQPLSEVIKSLYANEKDLLLDGLEIPKIKAFDYKGNNEAIENLLKEKLGEGKYTSQLYALTMGSGKTLLMGLMLTYDFILSFYYEDDKRFAKNALVFAPDKTIIESLKEIKSFDFSKIIPKEYEEVLLNIKYHYLEDTKTIPAFIGNYNVVVSNSQKIILKTRHKNNNDLFGDIKEEKKIDFENKRLKALRELKNLVVFIDEAHHSFGTTLEGKLKKVKKTIDFLNEEGKTALVGVVNLTGTPYIKSKMIDEVVYFFGLSEGIRRGILKQVKVLNYVNVENKEFVEKVLKKFFENYKEKLEGKLPKIAFYSPSKGRSTELKEIIEKVLIKYNKKKDLILEYNTDLEKNKNDFIALDTKESKKQIILLVGKGTEGWNCKSLVATALFRKPKSSIFVLQSTTRALRAIGDNTTKAMIFLSKENFIILNKELENNFNISVTDLNSQDQEIKEYKLEVKKNKKIIVNRKKVSILAVKKTDTIRINKSKYSTKDKISFIEESGIYLDSKNEVEYKKEISKEEFKKKNNLSFYEIVDFISRFTHLDFLEIKKILENSGFERGEFVKLINKKIGFIDFVISEILNNSFEYSKKEKIFSEEMELTKCDSFKINVNTNNKKLVVSKKENSGRLGFHINPYNFDSEDEKDLFFVLSNELEKDEAIKDVYFTGGITSNKHTDFYFEYWNAEQDKISKYFPDFLVETTKGRYLVIEVKGGNKKIDYEANKKSYNGKKENLFNSVFSKEIGFNEFKELNKNFDYKIIFDAQIKNRQIKLIDKIKNLSKDRLPEKA